MNSRPRVPETRALARLRYAPNQVPVKLPAERLNCNGYFLACQCRRGVVQSLEMIGTLLNVAGIVVGGTLGLVRTAELGRVTQSRLKVLLGAFTVYAGLSMAWDGFSGSFGHRAAQLGVAVLAMMIGKVTGRLLHIQRGFNHLGRRAAQSLSAPKPEGGRALSEGFIACTLLFCFGPLAILGSIQDGLLGSFRTLGVKAVLDGLVTMACAKVFGWGVLLSAFPVLAYQGSITLGAGLLEPCVRDPRVLQSISLTAGLMVFSVSLIILDLKKVPLADYLPSLVYAPLFTSWWLRG